jgi:hypothetical protein
MGRPAALASRRGRFLRRELVCGTFLMRSHAPFASGRAGFFGSKLVGGALLVSGLPSLAGDLPLLLLIHGTETPGAFVCHSQNPFMSI